MVLSNVFCTDELNKNAVEPKLAMPGAVSKMRTEPNRTSGYRISIRPGPNVPTAAGRYLHFVCILVFVA